jgi:hypothetical protein
MKREFVLVTSGSPVGTSTEVDSDVTTIPEPLSKIPVILPTLRTLPSTGIGR